MHQFWVMMIHAYDSQLMNHPYSGMHYITKQIAFWLVQAATRLSTSTSLETKIECQPPTQFNVQVGQIWLLVFYNHKIKDNIELYLLASEDAIDVDTAYDSELTNSGIADENARGTSYTSKFRGENETFWTTTYAIIFIYEC